jgi:hypothetical protein
MRKLLAATVLAVLLPACGSIVNGSAQTVTFDSRPSDARIVITNRAGRTVFDGRTPSSVTLNRAVGYFKPEVYKVRIEKEYCETTELYLTPKISGWFFANFLMFGGFWGMLIIDPLTGGMYTLAPDAVNQTLAAWGSTAAIGDGELIVALAQEVPPEIMQTAQRLR